MSRSSILQPRLSETEVNLEGKPHKQGALHASRSLASVFDDYRPIDRYEKHRLQLIEKTLKLERRRKLSCRLTLEPVQRSKRDSHIMQLSAHAQQPAEALTRRLPVGGGNAASRQHFRMSWLTRERGFAPHRSVCRPGMIGQDYAHVAAPHHYDASPSWQQSLDPLTQKSNSSTTLGRVRRGRPQRDVSPGAEARMRGRHQRKSCIGGTGPGASHQGRATWLGAITADTGDTALALRHRIKNGAGFLGLR